MKIGLFFGSFNPVHKGHLAIAAFLKEKNLFDQIWMVVSPNSPFKKKNDLIDENARLNMVKLATQNIPYLHVCDVEFSLPKPSYTINTLYYFENQYPNYSFALILGNDNMDNLHKWKNYKVILNKFMIYVYPRNNETTEKKEHPHIVYLNAPLLQISSTKVRALLKQGKSVTDFLPDSVVQYIKTL